MTNNLKEEKHLANYEIQLYDGTWTTLEALINQKEKEKEIEVLEHFEGRDQYYIDDTNWVFVEDRIKQLKEELNKEEQ